MRTVLHAGCGDAGPDGLPVDFRGPNWREVRLDLDPNVKPDIVASITNLIGVADVSVDAVWTAHVLEHLFAHEVPLALREFFRVLKPGGTLALAVPDIQAVAERVANGGLEAVAYESPAGPICPIDMLYGLRWAIAQGNHYMAHKTGFTATTLGLKMGHAGLVNVVVDRQGFNLVATGEKP